MKAHHLLLIPILCATLLSTACGDDPIICITSPDNPDTSNSLSLDEFITKVTTANATDLCNTAFKCPEFHNPDDVATLGRLGNLATCVDHFTPQMRQIQFPQIKASITAGRTQYDPTQAAECLTALNNDAQTCTPNSEATEQACEFAFIPTLTPGKPCTTNTECIDGTCENSQNNNTCTGTCTPNPEPTPPTPPTPPTEPSPQTTYAQLNQPCNTTTHCHPGLACTNLTLQDNDIHGTCLPLRQQNDPCQWTGECKAGLYCTATDIDQPGTCLPQIQEDQPCNPNPSDDSTRCTIGLRCLPTPPPHTTALHTCQSPHQSPKICEL